MKDKKSFGEYIAKKRKELNLTQGDLADKLYVLPTTISKWEIGVSYPDITNGAFYLKELKVKNYKMISLSIITILVYILLFVCNLYTKGNWLLTVAYPIATFIFLLLWLSVGLIYKLKSNKYINYSIATFAIAIAVLFTNPLLELLIETKTNATQNYNVLSGIILLITSIISLSLGVITTVYNKGNNK